MLSRGKLISERLSFVQGLQPLPAPECFKKKHSWAGRIQVLKPGSKVCMNLNGGIDPVPATMLTDTC